MNKLLCCLFLCLIFIGSSYSVRLECPTGWIADQVQVDKWKSLFCWQFVNEPMTFDSAMKECDARAKAEIVGTQVEGHLPESREIWQNKAILKMLPKNTEIFLASRREPGCGYFWQYTDLSMDVTMTEWEVIPRRIIEVTSNECVTINSYTEKWTVKDCYATLPYLCLVPILEEESTESTLVRKKRQFASSSCACWP